MGKKGVSQAYCGLIFVILIWGIAPMITLYFYRYFSPTVRVAYSGLVAVGALFLFSRKKLHLLNKEYFKVAVPTGLFMGLANILQKIGLQYTTPTHYAFLENLSCIVVPVLLWWFVKKKPTPLTLAASVLCLVSAFILSGMAGDQNGGSLWGDLLCALAGMFYGVNIAGTGAFAKGFYVPLYLMIQTAVETLLSAFGAIAFHFTGIELVKFPWDWKILLANALIVLIGSTFCWVIRTNSMKKVDATVVAVMMPFSSVITAVVSVLLGKDSLNLSLVLGAVLGLAAVILSGFGDCDTKPRKK